MGENEKPTLLTRRRILASGVALAGTILSLLKNELRAIR
jgi:hypothetical protein